MPGDGSKGHSRSMRHMHDGASSAEGSIRSSPPPILTNPGTTHRAGLFEQLEQIAVVIGPGADPPQPVARFQASCNLRLAKHLVIASKQDPVARPVHRVLFLAAYEAVTQIQGPAVFGKH